MADPDRRQFYWDLVDAAETDPAKADELLRTFPDLIEHHEYLGETALHFLCVENFTKGVKFLLSRGANPNATNEFGSSPLQEVASLHGRSASYLAVIELLLEAGADPHRRTETNDSAWELAQDSDDLELVRVLRKYVNMKRGRA